MSDMVSDNSSNESGTLLYLKKTTISNNVGFWDITCTSQ